MATAPSFIESLPCELARQILGYLTPKDLKGVREASLWVDLAIEYLFTTVFFAPRPNAMRTFENLTQHFGKNIVHLIFDDTQLNRTRLQNHAFTYTHEMVAVGRNDLQQQQLMAFHAYRSLFEQQEKIVSREEDFALLLRGLTSVVNLKKVSVIGGPSKNPTIGWYLNEGAHAADFAGTGIGASHWMDDKHYEEWDSRPFQNLLRALCVSNIRPPEIHIGNSTQDKGRMPRNMGLPLSSLRLPYEQGNEMTTRMIQAVFRNVRYLNLDLNYKPYPVQGDLDTLRKVLPTLKYLKSLSLGFVRYNRHACRTQRLLEGCIWPFLDSISLKDVQVPSNTMLEFLSNHSPRLKEVCLDRVGLGPPFHSSQDIRGNIVERGKPVLTPGDAKFTVTRCGYYQGHIKRIEASGEELVRVLHEYNEGREWENIRMF
ncbi:hypothetical protein MMC28_002223 [Mycoblastus sanguinarius]|nr:hypothetical protein [Mycoblastus sanguinarius]